MPFSLTFPTIQAPGSQKATATGHQIAATLGAESLAPQVGQQHQAQLQQMTLTGGHHLTQQQQQQHHQQQQHISHQSNSSHPHLDPQRRNQLLNQHEQQLQSHQLLGQHQQQVVEQQDSPFCAATAAAYLLNTQQTSTATAADFQQQQALANSTISSQQTFQQQDAYQVHTGGQFQLEPGLVQLDCSGPSVTTSGIASSTAPTMGQQYGLDPTALLAFSSQPVQASVADQQQHYVTTIVAANSAESRHQQQQYPAVCRATNLHQQQLGGAKTDDGARFNSQVLMLNNLTGGQVNG